MNAIGAILVARVALLHVYSLIWRCSSGPPGLKTFRNSPGRRPIPRSRPPNRATLAAICQGRSAMNPPENAKPVSPFAGAALSLRRWNRPPARSASCPRRTAASRRRRWRSRAAPRGCCGRWDFPASANCRCRRDGAPIWWR